MKQNDTVNILQKDYTLREAVNRREQKLPPLPADLNERVMGCLNPSPLQREREFKHRYWFYPAIAAVAASVLIIIGIGTSLKARRTDKSTGRDEIPVKVMAQTEARQGDRAVSRPVGATVNVTAPSSDVAPASGLTSIQDSSAVAKRHQDSKIVARHVATIPDTLGNGIFKSERNVVLAVKMLSECETSIQKSEQSACNAVVEATYHAIPHPHTTLVVCETGDYQIVGENQRTIIDI